MIIDKLRSINLIPKKIHYFYDDVNFYRKGKKHTQLRMCYTSWKRYCPDYEICLWTPQNEEILKIIRSSEFIKKKYEEKNWAFVSDFVRAYVLYQYGGIYLDTDVELLKNFDEFIHHKFFCSIEGDILFGENIPEPAVMGSEKNHPLLLEIIQIYKGYEIFNEKNPIANVIAQKALKKIYGFNKINYVESAKKSLSSLYDKTVPNKICKDFMLYKGQRPWEDVKKEVAIYPSEYFCPSWVSFGDKAITDKTVAIHWNQSSWWKCERKQEQPRAEIQKSSEKNKSMILQKIIKLFKVNR